MCVLFSSYLLSLWLYVHISIWILSDQNQASFICGKKWDMSQIFPGMASCTSVKMQITAAYTQALIRACFFLLHLKMRIVSFCSTILKPYRMYDAVSHHLTLFLSASSHFLCTPKNVLETLYCIKCKMFTSVVRHWLIFFTGKVVKKNLRLWVVSSVSRQLNKSGIGNTRNLTCH